MVSLEIILLVLLAYLTGAFPSAVWVGRTFYNTDVREYGSGNAGATNAFRVLGKKAGVPVLFLDIFKGWLAVNYVFLIKGSSSLNLSNPELFFENQLAFGIAAVVGHLFPIYTGFRGGKGIATMLGLLIAISPQAACFSICVFLWRLSRSFNYLRSKRFYLLFQRCRFKPQTLTYWYPVLGLA